MQAAAEAGTSGRADTSGAAPVVYTDKCTAFIKNLPFAAKAKDIGGIFSDCGGVKDVRLVHDQQGRSKVCLMRSSASVPCCFLHQLMCEGR